jgi:hypothetical protein
MKKRIWLALLPITLLWCGCSEDDPDHTREITAVASTSDVTVSQSTRTPIEGDTFGGKNARVLAKETTNSYSNTLWCNGTMTFNDGTKAYYGNTTTGSTTDFPETEKKVHLCGLYPADDWKCSDDTDISAGTTISNVVTYTVDGNTDIMWAASREATPSNAAALNFNHLLTRLNIKLKKDVNYPVVVHDIKLIKAAGENLKTECNVNLDAASVEDAVSFSGDSEVGLSCFQTDSDNPLPATGLTVPSGNETDAYILAPSLMDADKLKDSDDYTFEIVYSINNNTEQTPEKVHVNLEVSPGNAYEAVTWGRTFVIELCFTLKNVRATATIDDWGNGGTVSVENHQPYYPELTEPDVVVNTYVSDGMTNCYMVAPASELVFPVSRAYEWVSAGVWNDNLRIGVEYKKKFKATVLWSDDNVIVGTPQVYGKGKDARVEVKTNQAGNAVVALNTLDDTGNIVGIAWSYHIWVTTYKPDNGGMTCPNLAVTDYVFMDRDLGAETDYSTWGCIGLVYQFGRKDPFPSGVSGSTGYSALEDGKFLGTSDTDNQKYVVTNKSANDSHWKLGIAESIKNPTKWYRPVKNNVYDWLPMTKPILWDEDGEKKTIYDPCPTGWRVPVYVLNKNKDKEDRYRWAFAFTQYNYLIWYDPDLANANKTIYIRAMRLSFSSTDLPLILWGYRDENGTPILYTQKNEYIKVGTWWMCGTDYFHTPVTEVNRSKAYHPMRAFGRGTYGTIGRAWDYANRDAHPYYSGASTAPNDVEAEDENLARGFSVRCCKE